MARTPASNYSSPGYSYATADADAFDRTDVAGQGQSLDGHDHSPGKGLPIAAAAIANGTITSAMIADGTIQSVDIAAAGIANDRLGPDVARANLLTNGGFEIWQRGNGPFTTNGAYTTDRWVSFLTASDTMSISRDTANADVGSVACAACTCVVSGGTGSILYQPLANDIQQLKGRTVTLSVRMKTSTPNAARVTLSFNGTGGTNVYSPYHTGNGQWQTLTASQAVPSDATTVHAVALWFGASCTAYIDNAMLVVGSQAANYAPLHPADDLARCLRYYESLADAGDGSLQIYGYTPAGAQIVNMSIPFKVQKAVVPSATINGTWGVPTNCGQPTVANHGTRMVRLTIATTAAWAAGFAYAINNAAGTTVVEEANP